VSLLLGAVDVRPFVLLLLQLSVYIAILLKQGPIEFLNLILKVLGLRSVALEHVDLSIELINLLSHHGNFLPLPILRMHAFFFKVSDGFVPQLKLPSVVVDHLPHRVSQLVILVLQALHISTHFCDLGVVLCIVGWAASGVGRTKPPSRSGPIPQILIIRSPSPRTPTPGHGSLPRLLLLSLQVIVEHLDRLDHVDSIRYLILKI